MSYIGTCGVIYTARTYGVLAVAKINTLSVGQVLEKLRRTDANNVKPHVTQLDMKIDELEQDAQRLRAERLRIERNQKKAIKTNASK